MSSGEAGRASRPPDPASPEATAVLPETAAGLVQLEQLQQQLAESEERAKNHWEH